MAPTTIDPPVNGFASPQHPKVHVLVCSVPIYGHFEKLRVVAADLVKRGYQVSFLTSSCYSKSVEQIGARFLSLQGTADFDFARLDELFPERASVPPGPAQITYDFKHVIFAPLLSQYQSVQRFLADAAGRSETVVLVQDPCFLGAMPPVFGAPGLRPAGFISLGIAPLPISSIDTAPFNMGLPPDSSPEGRIRNAAQFEGVKDLFAPVRKDLAEKMVTCGARGPTGFFLDILVVVPDRYLQLCVPQIEYPRSDLPQSVRFVGALPNGLREKMPDPPFWDEILAHSKPIVVVSQGTASNDPEQLILPTLEALKDLDVLVIATLVRSDTIPGYAPPSNARIARFIPFDELFVHADLVVSNGGYGTIQQALCAGVPLVLAGMSEDKPEGNARAAWTGAAVNLATQTPDQEVVRAAVEKVIGTPTYRQRARALAAVYQKYDTLENIARSVEEFAGKAAPRLARQA
ncbi:hypothetical protein MMC13_003839 [Lambiella insularis]|nr:hypothetical protein [Lambiella insularis]